MLNVYTDITKNNKALKDVAEAVSAHLKNIMRRCNIMSFYIIETMQKYGGEPTKELS